MATSSVEQPLGRYPYSVISTNVAAAALAIAIVWLCIQVSDSVQDQVFNGLLTIFGALIGWAFGMFFAPYTKEEASRFSSIAQGISVFVSGYVVSKLDRFLEATMFTTTVVGGNTVDTPTSITWVRIGLFLCAALLVMLTVFTNRAYFRPETPSSAGDKSPPGSVSSPEPGIPEYRTGPEPGTSAAHEVLPVAQTGPGEGSPLSPASA